MATTDDYSKRMSVWVYKASVFIITLAVMIVSFGTATAAEAPTQYGDGIPMEATRSILKSIVDSIDESIDIQINDDELTFEQKVAAIEKYFESKGNLPAKYYAYDFVIAHELYANGDDSVLPWQAVAAIAMIETTGCKYTIENADTTKRPENCLGWGNSGFTSIQEGIHKVTLALSGNDPKTAQYYANVTFEQKMKRYNSVRPNYFKMLNDIMDEIHSESIPNA